MSSFIAPMVIFFALSGALQILDVHEAHGNYKPVAALSAIGRLHKQQVLAPELPRRSPGGPSDGGAKRAPGTDAPPASLATLLLKGLFLLESLALVVTTVLGAWIGLTHAKRARTCWCLLGAGTLIPLVLVLIETAFAASRG